MIDVMGLQTLSTSRVPAGRRLSYWNELSCDTFTGVEVNALDESVFAAGLRRLRLGSGVCVADVWSSGSTVRHTASHVSRQRDDLCFLLHLQLNGTSVNRQGRHSVLLRPGDATICDIARPWTVAFDANAQFLVCRLPNDEVRKRLPEIDDVAGTHISGQSTGMKVLSTFLRTLLAEAEPGQQSHWFHEIGGVVLDLTAASCRPDTHHPTRVSASEVRFQAIVDYIENHLTSSQLDVHSVAHEFGISARSIQKMFAAHGTTLSAHVLRRRLDLAAVQLHAPGSTITATALSNGFDDVSYFARTFRRAFGCSPRDYRRSYRTR